MLLLNALSSGHVQLLLMGIGYVPCAFTLFFFDLSAVTIHKGGQEAPAPFHETGSGVIAHISCVGRARACATASAHCASRTCACTVHCAVYSVHLSVRLCLCVVQSVVYVCVRVCACPRLHANSECVCGCTLRGAMTSRSRDPNGQRKTRSCARRGPHCRGTALTAHHSHRMPW